MQKLIVLTSIAALAGCGASRYDRGEPEYSRTTTPPASAERTAPRPATAAPTMPADRHPAAPEDPYGPGLTTGDPGATRATSTTTSTAMDADDDTADTTADDMDVTGSEDIERVSGMDQDATLRETITRVLRDDHQMGDRVDSIVIEVAGGAVTLSGQVRSSSEKRSIERAVRDIDGVTRVDSRLTVAKSSR